VSAFGANPSHGGAPRAHAWEASAPRDTAPREAGHAAELRVPHPAPIRPPSAGTRPRAAPRLNLGSGNEPLAGFVNVDRRAVPGVQVIADVTRLPFADGGAAEVVASSLLEHFADPYSVLSEVHRVLSPDGRFVMRVPAPWSQSGLLDKTHVFLADLKLWRQILGAYFRRVRVQPEGIRYRDNKLLAALLHAAVRGLGMYEFAQTWLFRCEGTRPHPVPPYVPWWLEEKYGPAAGPPPARGA
jgi:SAM-dependent methyltransferase